MSKKALEKAKAFREAGWTLSGNPYLPAGRAQTGLLQRHRKRQAEYDRNRQVAMNVDIQTQRNLIAAATKTTKYFDMSFKTSLIPKLDPTVLAWNNAHLMDDTTPKCLFYPSPGSSNYQVEGRKCLVKGIRIKGMLHRATKHQQSAGTPADFNANNGAKSAIRFVLVMDRQTNGAQLNPADVFAQYPSGTNDRAQNASLNPNTLSRYRILKDKIFWISCKWQIDDATGRINTEAATVPFKIYMKFAKPIQVNYKSPISTPGVVGDVIDNSFHLLAGDITGDESPACELFYSCRTIFCEDL